MMNKKISWKDENGEKLCNIREIEYKYEPYFKIFMEYKNYLKSFEELRNCEKYLNIYNDKENHDTIIIKTLQHIKATENFNYSSIKWYYYCEKFPKLTDLVIGYDTL